MPPRIVHGKIPPSSICAIQCTGVDIEYKNPAVDPSLGSQGGPGLGRGLLYSRQEVEFESIRKRLVGAADTGYSMWHNAYHVRR